MPFTRPHDTRVAQLFAAALAANSCAFPAAAQAPRTANAKGVPGIFVISQNQGGLVEQTAPCPVDSKIVATREVDGTLWHLCTTDPSRTSPNYQKTMEATWSNPAVTGVFIRLKWSDLEPQRGQFDDSILLREVDAAVAHAKFYSIAIKSGAEGDATPSWLFEPAPAGAGLTPVVLDWNEDSSACRLSSQHAYGDPTDDGYRELYLDMLTHVATVLKQSRARWRALAYIKLSGANAHSAENRLPRGCKVGGANCICNDQRWAEAGYSPEGLHRFYDEQMARIERDFPGKTFSYSLIQAGFPRVNAQGCYLDHNENKVCPSGIDAPIVGPFAQTEHIIASARASYPDDVAIAHLGLGQMPDFSDTSVYATGCPVPTFLDGTPAFGANAVGSGCPNKWATDVGAAGGLIHFQTSHAPEVSDAAELSSALENLWNNSTASMLEIYENRAWEAADAILDPNLPIDQQRTLADWNTCLHERRFP